MSSDIPDWVRSDCRLWGRQKRRVWEGRDWHGNVDGYAQSLLGRIREEREGAGQGQITQRWPEVFWGAGLDVQRSLIGMPERQYAVLHFQYVWNPEWGVTTDQKAGYLQVSRAQYSIYLGRAETWLHARLEQNGCLDAQLVERVKEIVSAALCNRSQSAINSQTGETPPAKRREVNYAALNRKILSVR